MIKSVVFVDGELRHCLDISKYQNLEEMYTHSIFNIYDLINKGDKNAKR